MSLHSLENFKFAAEIIARRDDLKPLEALNKLSASLGYNNWRSLEPELEHDDHRHQASYLKVALPYLEEAEEYFETSLSSLKNNNEFDAVAKIRDNIMLLGVEALYRDTRSLNSREAIFATFAKKDSSTGLIMFSSEKAKLWIERLISEPHIGDRKLDSKVVSVNGNQRMLIMEDKSKLKISFEELNLNPIILLPDGEIPYFNISVKSSENKKGGIISMKYSAEEQKVFFSIKRPNGFIQEVESKSATESILTATGMSGKKEPINPDSINDSNKSVEELLSDVSGIMGGM